MLFIDVIVNIIIIIISTNNILICCLQAEELVPKSLWTCV